MASLCATTLCTMALTEVEYKKKVSGIAYYKRLIKAGKELNTKQQKKFDELTALINKYNEDKLDNIDKEAVKQHAIEVIEKNKERSKERAKNTFKYVFGGLKFKTIKDANQYFSQYLSTHDETDNVEDADVITLVMNHPAYIPGMTIGIHYNPTYPTQKNFVGMKDGDCRHFSLYSCITGKSKSSINKLSNCLRSVVEKQIKEFRANHCTSECHAWRACDVCGKDCDNPEIHHVKPFSVLIEEFVKDNHLDIDEIEYVQEDGVRKLKDDELVNKFKEYHKSCELQYLCHDCHQRITN